MKRKILTPALLLLLTLFSLAAGLLRRLDRREAAYPVLIAGLILTGLLLPYLPWRPEEMAVYYACVPAFWIFAILVSTLILREWVSHLIASLFWLNGAVAAFLVQGPQFRAAFVTMLIATVLAAVMIFYLQHLLLEIIDRLIIGSEEAAETNRLLEITLGEKEVLLKEVHHRVKNNLQIISSLLNLHAGTLEDEKVRSILKESQGRVRSMALVHEELYQSEHLMSIDLETFIGDLLKIIDSSFRPAHLSLVQEIEMPPLALSPETALPLGLIMNELLTNIYKHAFAGLEAARLRIELLRPDNGDLLLCIRDWGNGLPENFATGENDSMGSLLIKSLVDQLGGSAELRPAEGGTEVRIRIPYAPPAPPRS